MPLSFQQVEAPTFQDNRHMKVVRLSALRTGHLYPPRKYYWYSFLLEAEPTPVATVRPEGLCQWKIPMTLWGIEPETFRLVAQCLNQLRHRVRTDQIAARKLFSQNRISQIFAWVKSKMKSKNIFDLHILGTVNYQSLRLGEEMYRSSQNVSTITWPFFVPPVTICQVYHL